MSLSIANFYADTLEQSGETKNQKLTTNNLI